MPFDRAFVEETLAPLLTSSLDGLTKAMPDDCEWVMVNPHPEEKHLPRWGLINASAPAIPLEIPLAVQAVYKRVLSNIQMTEGCMSAPLEYKVQNIVISQPGDPPCAVIEVRSWGKAKDGKNYDNTHCWVCQFKEQAGTFKMKQVRVYLDSAHLWNTMTDNSGKSGK